MVDPKDINAQVTKVLKLIEKKFSIQSDDLGKAMRKVGRRLPKKAHDNAKFMVKFQEQAGHPKLAVQLKPEEFTKAFNVLQAALNDYDVKDHRKGAILGALGGLVFNLILVFTLFVIILLWRGFL